MKKKSYYFLFFLLFVIFLFSQYNIIIYGNVSGSDFSVYIAQNRAFSFQLRDNITQFLTLNATNNAFNVTINSLFMRYNEGRFTFIPNENSTIRINHNMDYVRIINYNDTFEDMLVDNNSFFDVYENKLAIIIFEIKGYDVSGVVVQIAFFIVSVVGLIAVPPISDIMSKNDKMQQVFIWACGWLFFGILFFTWIYVWS